MAHTCQPIHNNRDVPATTPWMNLTEGADYERRGRRWLAREAKAGRVRCARVGGRGELLSPGANGWTSTWKTWPPRC